MRFPELIGRNLEGERVALPSELAGDPRIAVVAFERRQQDDVDTWLPWLEQTAASDPGLAFFELPTIGRRWSPGRRFIDGGMAAAIRDAGARRRTVTVYTDVGAVVRALELPGTREIAVLALDRAGEVRGRALGAFDEAKAAAVAAALEACRGRPVD
jgi:hypothetical protein